MGFRKPDLVNAYAEIRRCIGEIRSPYNDGWTSAACKHDLYLLKCFLEDQYKDLPKFSEEEEWEKERLINKLRTKT